MADDATYTAITAILQCLAQGVDAGSAGHTAQGVKLPGPKCPAKDALEAELAAAVVRVQRLEAKAVVVNQSLPVTPNEMGSPSAFSDAVNGTPGRNHKTATTKRHIVNTLLGTRDVPGGERLPKFTKLSDEDLETLRDYVDEQSKQLDGQKSELEGVHAQLFEQKQLQEQVLTILEVERVSALERELKKHQQANEAFQKALREIGEIVTAVAKGDLSKKVQIHSVEMDPEITTFKRVCCPCMVMELHLTPFR